MFDFKKITFFIIFSLLVFVFWNNTAALGAQNLRHNVGGSAWSSGVGYIYFSCEDQGTCSAIDYGVDINPTSGIMSGHAWSPAVGWISFNESDLNGCPTDGGAACLAKLNLTTKKFEGWARALTPKSIISRPPPTFGGSGPTNVEPPPVVPIGGRPVAEILIPNGDIFVTFRTVDNVQTLGRVTVSSGRTIDSWRWQLNGTCDDRNSGTPIPDMRRSDGLPSARINQSYFPSGPGVNTLYLWAKDNTGEYSECASINIVVTPEINQIVSALTPARGYAYSFTINDIAYVGGGHGINDGQFNYGYGDLWAYNPNDATWTRKMDFPGAHASYSASFSIDGKGYVGLFKERATPLSAGEYRSELYSFDPGGGGSGSWAQEESFPRILSSTYRLMFSTSLNNKGYVGIFNSLSGMNGCSNYLTTTEIWEYDPARSFGSRWRLINTWNGGTADSWINNREPTNEYRLCTTGSAFTNAVFGIGNDIYLVGGDRSMYEQGSGGWGRPFIFKWNYSGDRHVQDYIIIRSLVSGAPGPFTIQTNGRDSGETELTIGSLGQTFRDSFGAQRDKSNYIAEYYHFNEVMGTHELVSGDARSINIEPYYTTRNIQYANAYNGSTRIISSPSAAGPVFEIETRQIPGNGIVWANTVDTSNQVWKYSVVQNTWTKVADFPVDGISGGITFVLNNKGYILPNSWRNNAPKYLGQMIWEYDPSRGSLGAWTMKHAFGGGSRSRSFSFALGNRGYIGHGDGQGFGSTYSSAVVGRNDLWEIDVEDDTYDRELPVANLILPINNTFANNYPYAGGSKLDFRVGATLGSGATTVKYNLSNSYCNTLQSAVYSRSIFEAELINGTFEPKPLVNTRTGGNAYENIPLSLSVVDDKGRASVNCPLVTYDLQTPWDAKPLAVINRPMSNVLITRQDLFSRGFDATISGDFNRPDEYIENYTFTEDAQACREGRASAIFAIGNYPSGGDVMVKTGGLKPAGLYRIYLVIQTKFRNHQSNDWSTNCPYIDVEVI